MILLRKGTESPYKAHHRDTLTRLGTHFPARKSAEIFLFNKCIIMIMGNSHQPSFFRN